MKTAFLRMVARTLTLVLLLSLCACGNTHHAFVCNDRAEVWIDPVFAAANLTSGIYLEGAETVTDAEAYPRSRVLIVDTQEVYDEIFKSETSLSVDFDREMLVVCTYTSTYVRPVEIVSLKQKGSTLAITLREKQKNDFFFAISVRAACQPYQRYVVIQMDKLDVTAGTLSVKS